MECIIRCNALNPDLSDRNGMEIKNNNKRFVWSVDSEWKMRIPLIICLNGVFLITGVARANVRPIHIIKQYI